MRASGVPSRRAIAIASVAALVAIAAGIALSYQIHWFPVQATTQAKETDTLYHVLVIASVPIFVLVVAVILFSVWQFRMRPGEELKDGPPIHGNTRLEVFWTAIPAALLLGLVSYSFVVLHENERKPAGVPEIQIGVTGQQFFWDYEYPSSVTGGKPVKSYQLYLPEGATVYFNMRSKDVIHAFWIPAFRLQEDVVPGITTHYRATLDRVGTYPVVCNLLCGAGHSLMRSAVHVVSPAQFRAWLASQERSGSTVATASTAPPGSASAPAAVARTGAG
ncbi:MAG TPA: cytochrome c oxidase subunit II [Solirubrobacteraceae bacterium]|jgi:cytochrome c oxidase subunit 2|nr:cytochrome c oxidase subunit II [Solirubrobacteraceae bacterium]